MKIDWASSFREDGSRRRPPPSTMHGWLAKMRGTLLGDEKLRNKGMREMRDARAVRKHRREQRRLENRSIFSFFAKPKKSAQAPVRSVARSGTRRPPPNRLVARPSQARKPSGASTASRRPTASRRTTTSSRTSHSRPQYSSRRGSHR